MLDNGARTMGRAEMWFGTCRDARHLAVVLLGTGVGEVMVDGTPPASVAGGRVHGRIELRAGGSAVNAALAAASWAAPRSLHVANADLLAFADVEALQPDERGVQVDRTSRR